MLKLSKPQRLFVSTTIVAVSFAIAYGLRNLVHIEWPNLGVLIAFSVYVLRAVWVAVRHGPRALLPH